MRLTKRLRLHFTRNHSHVPTDMALMGGPDGVGERNVLSWQEAYDRPIPGEDTKQPANVANAPWALDVDRLPAGVPLPTAIFENRAMLLPRVALAPPSPPAVAATKAAVAQPPLRVASDAFQGIKLAPSAGALPRSDRADTTRAITAGPYKLYPEVRKEVDGTDSVVFYKAVNRETMRAEFVVGPGSLEPFKANAKQYSEVGLRVFAHGDPDGGAIASMKVMQTAMDRGLVAGFKEVLGAWNEARKDPRWVTNTTLQIVTSAVPAARAEGVVATEAVATAEVDVVAGGGVVRNINVDPAVPLRGTRTMNCANCAIATDATLAGRPACALAGVGTTPAEVAAFYPGQQWVAPAGTSGIEGIMTSAGPGSRGIVFGSRGPGQIGHFFNVSNEAGTIHFLDGQASSTANLNAGYKSFYLLRTN